MKENPGGRKSISEDWLAVIIAFAMILLSVIGILSDQGLVVTF